MAEPGSGLAVLVDPLNGRAMTPLMPRDAVVNDTSDASAPVTDVGAVPAPAVVNNTTVAPNPEWPILPVAAAVRLTELARVPNAPAGVCIPAPAVVSVRNVATVAAEP